MARKAQFATEESGSGEFQWQEDVYYIYFKCSLHRILDYSGLQGYMTGLHHRRAGDGESDAGFPGRSKRPGRSTLRPVPG